MSDSSNFDTSDNNTQNEENYSINNEDQQPLHNENQSIVHDDLTSLELDKSQSSGQDDSDPSIQEESQPSAKNESEPSVHDDSEFSLQDEIQPSLKDAKSSKNKDNYDSKQDLSINGKTYKQIPGHFMQGSSFEENKSSSSQTALSQSSIGGPLTLLNRENAERIKRTYHYSYENSLAYKEVQQIPLDGYDENIKYQPEMLDYDRMSLHFKISRSRYNWIVETCKLLDELLQQKLEFEIAPYEKGNIVCELIRDVNKNNLMYLYKGCIDMEAFNETGAIIPHGPGSLYKSTGQFIQGMFKKGELDGLGRSIYNQHAWHQGEYSHGRYHGGGAC